MNEKYNKLRAEALTKAQEDLGINAAIDVMFEFYSDIGAKKVKKSKGFGVCENYDSGGF